MERKGKRRTTIKRNMATSSEEQKSHLIHPHPHYNSYMLVPTPHPSTYMLTPMPHSQHLHTHTHTHTPHLSTYTLTLTYLHTLSQHQDIHAHTHIPAPIHSHTPTSHTYTHAQWFCTDSKTQSRMLWKALRVLWIVCLWSINGPLNKFSGSKILNFIM